MTRCCHLLIKNPSGRLGGGPLSYKFIITPSSKHQFSRKNNSNSSSALTIPHKKSLISISCFQLSIPAAKMKLTNYIPFVAFASLATAVPASFSISVNVNGGSLRDSLHGSLDACTRICAFEQVKCGKGQVRAARGCPLIHMTSC